MAMPPAQSGRAPVLECVREGYLFLGRDWRAILAVSAVGAAAVAPLDVWSQAATQGRNAMAILAASALAVLPQAWVMAAFFRRALSRGAEPLALRFGRDEINLAGVALAIGFFFVIVFFVAIFILILALAGLLAGANLNAEAMSTLPPQEAAQQFVAALGPEGQVIFFVLIAAATVAGLWLGARLALAGPATIDTQRMQAFSTWAWTKGNSGSIALCFLLIALGGMVAIALIGAAPMLAVQALLGGEEAVRTPGSPASWAASYVASLLGLVFFLAPWAGTTAYLYRGLRPQ